MTEYDWIRPYMTNMMEYDRIWLNMTEYDYDWILKVNNCCVTKIQPKWIR